MRLYYIDLLVGNSSIYIKKEVLRKKHYEKDANKKQNEQKLWKMEE